MTVRYILKFKKNLDQIVKGMDILDKKSLNRLQREMLDEADGRLDSIARNLNSPNPYDKLKFVQGDLKTLFSAIRGLEVAGRANDGISYGFEAPPSLYSAIHRGIRNIFGLCDLLRKSRPAKPR